MHIDVYKLTCSISVFLSRVLMAQMELKETQEHQETPYVATC